MKKYLFFLSLLLLLFVIFSCTTVSYYEVRTRYMAREGITRYELPIPISKYFTKWRVTFRADRSEAGTDYFIIVDYLGEKWLYLDTLKLVGDDLALEFKEAKKRRLNAPDRKVEEWVVFKVSRRLLDDIAYRTDIKAVVSGMGGKKEFELNEPIRDGIINFLEATAPEKEKEKEKK